MNADRRREKDMRHQGTASDQTAEGTGCSRTLPFTPVNTPGEKSPAELFASRGFQYLDQGKPEEALPCFNRVVELQPDSPDAYNNLGYVHERLDHLSSAMQLYRKALDLDAKNVEARINIAHIRDQEGNYYGALQSYEAALAVDPDNVDAHFCLGVLYDRHDMFDEAAQQYQQVLDRDPVHRKAVFNLGRLHIQTGNNVKAMELLQLLITLAPDHADAWYAIGALYEELGRIDAALYAWQQSLKLNPLQVKTNINLARLQYDLWKSKVADCPLQEITQRLHFVLALDPFNGQAKILLEQIQTKNVFFSYRFPMPRHELFDSGV